MKYAILLVALACLPLGGCGALVAGAAGGAVATAVTQHNAPPADYIPPRPAR
jgi:hypothetical protein